MYALGDPQRSTNPWGKIYLGPWDTWMGGISCWFAMDIQCALNRAWVVVAVPDLG